MGCVELVGSHTVSFMTVSSKDDVFLHNPGTHDLLDSVSQVLGIVQLATSDPLMNDHVPLTHSICWPDVVFTTPPFPTVTLPAVVFARQEPPATVTFTSVALIAEALATHALPACTAFQCPGIHSARGIDTFATTDTLWHD